MARKKKTADKKIDEKKTEVKPTIRRKEPMDFDAVKITATSDSVPVLKPVMKSTGRVVNDDPVYGMTVLRTETGTALNVHNAVMVANGIKPGTRMNVNDYKKMVQSWLKATA